MAVFKCKMCGGALDIKGNETVAVCEYCGTRQTLPRLDDGRRANLYDRANHFRRNNEYDKAMSIYEQLLNEDGTDAEAYWSLVLCRYGIEYVEDPYTRRRVPTVNRAQYTSVFDDEDYKSALKYADGYQKSVYEEEAKAINEIQKGILEVSRKEEPFDIFICYKETDADGRRTPDSVLAGELYQELTKEGFKVFFSRITLEDKLGTAYEPYIFAALNSAKVMVVLGTKPEYFNAVWVKNEWSRYLALIKNGAKKTLIPAYRGMDPYDLPDEFSNLQAQDMSKLGFMQDLIRGIKKIAYADNPKATLVKETVISGGSSDTAPLLKRAFMFLEDGEWDKADDFCEQVLNLDPECAQAYLGKLMAELQVRKQDDLKDCAEPFNNRNNYQKTVRFAGDRLKSALAGYIEHIKTRNENARLDGIYNRAKTAMASANTESAYKEAAKLFELVSDYMDSSALAQECCEKAEIARKDAILANGKSKMTGGIVSDYEAAIKLFESISGWRDADEQASVCEQKIEELRAKSEAERVAKEKRRKRDKKIAIITTPIVCAIIAFIVVLTTIIIPNGKYNDAVELYETGNKYQAARSFYLIKDYRDAKERSFQIWGEITERKAISAGGSHTIGLRANGTVVAVGDNDFGECGVDGWTDIVAAAAVTNHTVGLTADGTVVAVGNNASGQCDVEGWTDIVAVSAGMNHTVGLKADGTVVAVGSNAKDKCDVDGWTDIAAVSAGYSHTVGLKADGTVVAVGSNTKDKCDVDDWADIIAISAYSLHTVGLKADGTVVAVGSNASGQCDVDDWTDIIAVSAGISYTIGLKADGTVVAVGNNDDGQCDVDDWAEIAAVSAGAYHTLGLKSDSTVVAVGDNDNGECDVDGWTEIKTP